MTEAVTEVTMWPLDKEGRPQGEPKRFTAKTVQITLAEDDQDAEAAMRRHLEVSWSAPLRLTTFGKILLKIICPSCMCSLPRRGKCRRCVAQP